MRKTSTAIPLFTLQLIKVTYFFSSKLLLTFFKDHSKLIKLLLQCRDITYNLRNKKGLIPEAICKTLAIRKLFGGIKRRVLRKLE